MKHNKEEHVESASNNLGQPKVFTNGITQQGGVPSLDTNQFTRENFENVLKQVSRKVATPARSGEEKK